MNDTKTRPSGYRDPRAARAKRTLIKHRRWAEELRAAGWTVVEPAPEPRS